MAENSAEDNLDCNDLLLELLSNLIATASIFWTSGAVDLASLQRERCGEIIAGLLCLTSATNHFRLPSHKGKSFRADGDA
jgi:hypothetical protein